MKPVAILVLVLLLTLPVSQVMAQPQPGTSQPAYLLGPGDTIDVVVFGQVDLTQTYTIGPDGFVSLPLIGRVKAAGRTVDQLASELARLYRQYLKAPAITVRVKEFRVDRVYVMGQVTRPGEYQLQAGVGLVSLIAAAGGMTPKADSKKAVVMRGPQTIPIDLDQALLSEARGQLTPLRPNDIVFIPEADRRVTVLGQVGKPGTYEFQEGSRISDALGLAGGLTALAASGKATLTRANETVPLDVEAILKGTKLEANIALQAGDLIVVPELTSRVAVLGFVKAPGAFTIKDGDRVLDAIVMAGGNAERGDLGNVALLRQPVGTGQPKVTKLDLRKAMQGDAKENIALQDRDVIFVAEVGSPDPAKVAPWVHLGVGLLRLLFGGI